MTQPQQKSPKHVAFIMDGNRRWAKKHALQVLQGHNTGVKVVRPLVEFAAARGITHLTFWAFSTENWKRDAGEVRHLMELFRSLFTGTYLAELVENGVRLRVIGDISKFPEDIQKSIAGVLARSKDNTRITVTIALNYGGREEIIHSVKKLLSEAKGEKLKVESLTAKGLEKYLYTVGMPDPDIIVRTGGEKRLSGYLPWQSIYSELFFVDTLWPDFRVEEFEKILSEYAARERRFGK